MAESNECNELVSGWVQGVQDPNLGTEVDVPDWETFGRWASFSDLKLFPDLRSVAERTKKANVKSAAYLLIGALLANTDDSDVKEFLMSRLGMEKTMGGQRDVLMALSSPPAIEDCTVFLPYLSHKNDGVRYAAFGGLKKCPPKEVERGLIEVLTRSEDKHDLYWAALDLREIGTPDAVPALKAVLARTRTYDIQIVALYTISMIAKESECDYYVEMLLNKEYRHKWVAVHAISLYCGNDGAIPHIVERVKRLLAQSERCACNGDESEIYYATSYLSRFFDHDKQIPRVFTSIKQKWEQLHRNEKLKLQENVLFFQDCEV